APANKGPRPGWPGSTSANRAADALRLIAAVAAAVAAVAPAGPGAAAAPGARPLLARLGLVDRQGAAVELGAVEGLDGRLGAVAHLHEAEAPAAAGLAVGDDLRPLHGAVLAEGRLQVRGGRLERQVAHVNVLRHESLSAGQGGPAHTN